MSIVPSYGQKIESRGLATMWRLPCSEFRTVRHLYPLPLIHDCHTEIVILASMQNWIALFGVPRPATTDRGSQFESTLYFKLCDFLGCERIRTAAYHAVANKTDELLHRQLKAALMSHADREHWVENGCPANFKSTQHHPQRVT